MGTLTVLLLVAISACLALTARAEVRACYYGDWARYRSGGAQLLPGDIDPFVCTHIIVSFVKVTPDYNLAPFDPDSPSQVYPALAGLKAQNPNLKILAAVGGATHDNSLFTSMTSSYSARNTFGYNAVSFLRQYNFDGLDVDWEFPHGAGKTGFTDLLYTLNIRFAAESSSLPRLLLTIAVSASSATSDASYSYYHINQYVDYVFLMSYDFHGTWNTETGHNSPLHPSVADTLSWQQEFNVAWTADFWTGKGVSASKLVVGFPTYGRTFTLSNSYNYGVGASASGGPGGQYLGQYGNMAYFEVCDEIRAGALRYWDSNSKVPYLVRGSTWVTYDDTQSYCEKLKWMQYKGFAGAMFWAIESDDHHNLCGLGAYPLINYIKSNWGNSLYCTSGPSSLPAAPTVASDGGGSTGDDPDCTNHLDGSLFAHPTDCTKYDQCDSAGVKYTFSCQSGLLFHSIYLYCDWPASAVCASGASGDGATPGATAAPITAAPATQAPTAAPTAAPTTQAPPSGGSASCTGHLDGLPFADTLSCEHFYKCTPEGVLSRHLCSTGLYFNPTYLYCDWPNNVACTGSGAGGTSVDPECEGHLDGLAFADPTSCASYLTCSADGTKSTGSCGTLYFNDVDGFCDYTYNVNCGSRPI